MSHDPLRAEARSSWPATLLVSLLLVVGVHAGGQVSARSASSMLFALAPFVLLAGLHGRIEEFLHSRRRAHFLPLPLEPARHWEAATAIRRVGFVVAALIASIVLGAGVALGWVRPGLSILAQWGAYLLFVAVLEPLVPAWSAYLGRRFEGESPASRAQSGLGGGWTQPEAVIHLYAPALMLLAAAALAMPAQLSLERALEGGALSDAHWAMTLGPLALAVYWRKDATRLYAEGLHEAVPWVQEAERTLSGPPTPRGTPTFLAPLSDIWVRTRGIALWRSTTGASLRLVGVLLASALSWLVAPESVALATPFCLALLAIWLAPLVGLGASRWRWQHMVQRLPSERSAARIDVKLGAYWGLPASALVLTSLALRLWSLS